MLLEVTKEPPCGSVYFGAYLLKAPTLCLRQFLITEIPLKMMKNAFYLMLKALLFSRHLHFCSDFGYLEKRLDKKTKVIFKFMTSQTE